MCVLNDQAKEKRRRQSPVATCANTRVGSVRSQNMCTHRRRLNKKCSPRLVLQISCVRIICFTNINKCRPPPSSLLSDTLEFCQVPLSTISVQTHADRQATPTFDHTVFSPHPFVLLSFPANERPAAHNFCSFYFFGV